MVEIDLSPVEIMVRSINYSRPMNAGEVWERYEKACKRYKVVPLFGQAMKALKVLQEQRRIEYKGGLVRRIAD